MSGGGQPSRMTCKSHVTGLSYNPYAALKMEELQGSPLAAFLEQAVNSLASRR